MKIKENFIKLWIYSSGILVISIIFFIIFYIFIKGIEVINLKFLTDIPRGMILGQEGGIYPAIVGSILSTIIACIIGGLFGISTAIYVVFYQKSRIERKITNIIISCVGGVPSIVLGLFGYTIFLIYFRMGKSIIAGAFTIAIMIYPTIEIKTEKIFRDIDKNLINSSYSLGVSKIYTIFKIIIPSRIKEINSTMAIVFGYAIGATAPIMFCMAVINSPVNFNILRPSMSLSYHLYMLLTQGISEKMAYGTAFVLLFIIIVVVKLSQIIIKKRK